MMDEQPIKDPDLDYILSVIPYANYYERVMKQFMPL